MGLYLNPPEHALVLSVDEKSRIQHDCFRDALPSSLLPPRAPKSSARGWSYLTTPGTRQHLHMFATSAGMSLPDATPPSQIHILHVEFQHVSVICFLLWNSYRRIGQ